MLHICTFDYIGTYKCQFLFEITNLDLLCMCVCNDNQADEVADGHLCRAAYILYNVIFVIAAHYLSLNLMLRWPRSIHSPMYHAAQSLTQNLTNCEIPLPLSLLSSCERSDSPI